MDAKDLKDYIIINEKIKYILEELGCHHIDDRNDKYVSAANPNGDNKGAIVVYKDNLNCDNYTRNIVDKYGNSDLFSLVCYIKDIYFTEALKWVCGILGLDFYSQENNEIPESLKWTRQIIEMCEGDYENQEYEIIKPISEKILKYYKPVCNKLFLSDGVSYETQSEFEVGYDLQTHRYTIPIRDELNTLVGVKGRYYLKIPPSYEDKFIYLEPCAKSQILFGLHKTMPYIKEKGKVIVVESEKSVMVLWDLGIRNVVAIGGHKLSKKQVEKIIRLGINEVILCYDEDVNRDKETKKINKKDYKVEAEKFISQIKVSAMVDLNGELLKEKESPVDNIDNFNKLYDERKVLQDGE